MCAHFSCSALCFRIRFGTYAELMFLAQEFAVAKEVLPDVSFIQRLHFIYKPSWLSTISHLLQLIDLEMNQIVKGCDLDPKQIVHRIENKLT